MAHAIALVLLLSLSGAIARIQQRPSPVADLPLASSGDSSEARARPLKRESWAPGESGRHLAQRFNTIIGQLATAQNPDGSFPNDVVGHIDTSQEEKIDEKNSRAHLLRAQKSFDAANDWAEVASNEHGKLTEMAVTGHGPSPERYNYPSESLSGEAANVNDVFCSTDYTKCPIDWDQKGASCSAASTYSGPCPHDLNFSAMTLEEKQGLASFCKVKFPCQDDCQMNFVELCPSSWRETTKGVCTAPVEYDGECSREIAAAAMSNSEKTLFAQRCRARWPCDKPSTRDYSGTCPAGWILQAGHACMAPSGYAGPCPSISIEPHVSVAQKKMYEATCGVVWPEHAKPCPPDYSAPCPSGWSQIILGDGIECRAPVGYEGCNAAQVFRGMTLAEKEDWANMCHAAFPCQG